MLWSLPPASHLLRSRNFFYFALNGLARAGRPFAGYIKNIFKISCQGKRTHFPTNFILVYGLKCYDCIGSDKTCSKDALKADNSKEKTCTIGMDKCIRIWSKKDGDTGVINSCSNEALCKSFKDKCDESTEGDCAVGCCDTDLCNAGSPVSFSMILMTVCSALGLALVK